MASSVFTKGPHHIPVPGTDPEIADPLDYLSNDIAFSYEADLTAIEILHHQGSVGAAKSTGLFKPH